MKILIVFFALVILNTSFFIYQSDMNAYIRESEMIKKTCEECAAGAALFYSEEDMAEGFYVFNREEAEKYIRFIIEQNFENPELVSYEIIYNDSPGVAAPAIEVIIEYGGMDRFRLNFLEKDSIKRAGKYEYLNY